MGNIIIYMYSSPDWFFGYSIFMELFFMLIILAVSYYSLKVYKLTGQRQAKLFSLAFLFIAAAYLVQSLFSLSIIYSLNQVVSDALRIIGVNTFNMTIFFLRSTFFLSGLVTLTYMTFKESSKKAYSLILILVFFSMILSWNRAYTFYLFSSIFLIYIASYYLVNYLKKKRLNTLLVLIAFIFLLFGSIHFIFSVNHALFYVIGHFLELIAYILILINLILVIKK